MAMTDVMDKIRQDAAAASPPATAAPPCADPAAADAPDLGAVAAAAPPPAAMPTDAAELPLPDLPCDAAAPEATASAFVAEDNAGMAAESAAPWLDPPEPAPPVATAVDVSAEPALPFGVPAAPRPVLDATTQTWDAQRIDPAVIAFHDRYSAICEQYRAIRARLLTMNTRHEPQVVAITSAVPEEGKSVSTANLGLIMAEGGEHRIVIADADFRRTSIARMLGLPAEPGLAEVLRGKVSLPAALRPTPFPNLKVLPAGNVPDNAYGELLSGPLAKSTLDELRRWFDYALVDTPPVATVSDVCLLAPHCDGALLVIEMGRTPEPTVQQAVRTLQANNVRIFGALLSRFRERGAGYHDRYYQSSYYYR